MTQVSYFGNYEINEEIQVIEEKSFKKRKRKLRSREECGIRRSRQKLSNEYLVAKFGFDAAENESSKVCQMVVR